jgi:hypothetical protein
VTQQRPTTVLHRAAPPLCSTVAARPISPRQAGPTHRGHTPCDRWWLRLSRKKKHFGFHRLCLFKIKAQHTFYFTSDLTNYKVRLRFSSYTLLSIVHKRHYLSNTYVTVICVKWLRIFFSSRKWERKPLLKLSIKLAVNPVGCCETSYQKYEVLDIF